MTNNSLRWSVASILQLEVLAHGTLNYYILFVNIKPLSSTLVLTLECGTLYHLNVAFWKACPCVLPSIIRASKSSMNTELITDLAEIFASNTTFLIRLKSLRRAKVPEPRIQQDLGQAFGISLQKDCYHLVSSCLIYHQDELHTPEEKEVYHKNISKMACQVCTISGSPGNRLESVAMITSLDDCLKQLIASVRHSQTL